MDLFESAVNDADSSDEDAAATDVAEAAVPADTDACSLAELNTLFKQTFHITSEEAVSLKKTVVLYMDGTKDFGKIAVEAGTHAVNVYDLSASVGLSNVKTLHYLDAAVKSSITGIKFTNNDPNQLFIATLDNGMFLMDLRTEKVVQNYKEPDKTTICFDLNQNDRILCAGSDQINSEVFLLFFDVRQPDKPLGGYWESHNDIITQVKFHPTKPDFLASGSTDGLINVFDINISEEDDALLYCLNTESSVETLKWHTDSKNRDVLSCITHTQDLHFYDVNESELIVSFNRIAIAEHVKRKSEIDCCVVNCHSTADGDIFALTGSFSKNESMRSLRLEEKNLLPDTNFVGNKQRVRTSLFDNKTNTMITCGDGGLISVWKSEGVEAVDNVQQSSNLKAKTQHKKHKSKPY